MSDARSLPAWPYPRAIAHRGAGKLAPEHTLAEVIANARKNPGTLNIGTPPPGNADYAFFEHSLASMDPQTGRSATLWPHGILFRTPEVRKALLEADLIEAVRTYMK